MARPVALAAQQAVWALRLCLVSYGYVVMGVGLDPAESPSPWRIAKEVRNGIGAIEIALASDMPTW